MLILVQVTDLHVGRQYTFLARYALSSLLATSSAGGLVFSVSQSKDGSNALASQTIVSECQELPRCIGPSPLLDQLLFLLVSLSISLQKSPNGLTYEPVVLNFVANLHEMWVHVRWEDVSSGVAFVDEMALFPTRECHVFSLSVLKFGAHTHRSGTFVFCWRSHCVVPCEYDIRFFSFSACFWLFLPPVDVTSMRRVSEWGNSSVRCSQLSVFVPERIHWGGLPIRWYLCFLLFCPCHGIPVDGKEPVCTQFDLAHSSSMGTSS